LFSFNAAGQLAKSLVYFGWKGLDVVRSYVIPSNPRTTAQVTQRGYFTAAVTAIHDAMALAAHALDAVDKAAYAALASTRAKPRTWFNEIVKLWVDVMVAGNTPIIYTDFTVTDPTVSAFDCIVYLNYETPSDLAAGKFYFGTTKTALINSHAGTLVPGVSEALVAADLSAFLTAGVKYYMQFKPDAADPCEGAVSGIVPFLAV